MGFRKLPKNKHIGLMYPRQIVLVTSGSNENNNILPLVWTVILSRNPPIVGISVAPSRYSHNLIKDHKEFTINIPTKKIIDKVMYCGQISGKNINKFKKTTLTPLKGMNVKCPRIKECISHIECKVIDMHTYGDHTFFIGEVATCIVNDEYLKLNKIINVEKIEIPYHLTGEFFTFNQMKIYRI
jgi:flavin reductase (DIM6/NTAB) family NADH-FMN oxidoreductase RutF